MISICFLSYESQKKVKGVKGKQAHLSGIIEPKWFNFSDSPTLQICPDLQTNLPLSGVQSCVFIFLQLNALHSHLIRSLDYVSNL